MLIHCRFQPNPESWNEDVTVIGQNTWHSEDKETNDNWNKTVRCSRGFVCLHSVDTSAYFNSYFVVTYIRLVNKLQKPKYEQSDQVLHIFDNIGQPYWIRHFEFWQSNFRFGFSDLKNIYSGNITWFWSLFLQKYFWNDIFFFAWQWRGQILNEQILNRY